MMLPHITFLLVLLICSVQSCSLHRSYHHDPSNTIRDVHNSSIQAQPGHELLKRWYGVKTLPPTSSGQDFLSPYYYPWPVTCTSPKIIQPIRYCFKDERSAKNIQSVLDRSIAMWTQAMRVSSLSIDLEPTCQGNAMCVCGDAGVATDALVISDETKDDDEDWNRGEECYTASTVGYRYVPKGQPDVPYRHYMKICSVAPQYSWGQADDAVREMAHELGHVLGLQHEHQRPDRNEFLWFKCKNLKGYDEAYEKADLDEEAFCNHEFYATKFFPTVLEYIRGDVQHMDNPDSQAIASNVVKSDEFDYNSIMIYDGDLMSKDRDRKKYVLFRREADGGIGPPVWMGGGVEGDLGSTKLSERDIARVAMLYDNGEQVKDVSWGPVRVKIRDRLDVVVPSPRKRDEL